MHSIYIHIPFCERICSYCDFPKRVGTKKQMEEYLNALEQEMKQANIKDSVDTLYIGGGTPSILTGELLEQFARMIKPFRFSDSYEFTIECNPEHVTPDLIRRYKNMGINRISLGVQTFNNRLLKLLNRGHTKDLVYQSIDMIREVGIDNISVDLMFALPMQSKQDLLDDLKQLQTLKVPHIACYSLILEEKTVFSKLIRENKLELQQNEVEAEMFEIVINQLKEWDYHHYEISNFAHPGYESRHNQVYWKNNMYYGFGMGASGYVNGLRYSNEHLVSSYIHAIETRGNAIEYEEEITAETRLSEAMMLGLRLIDGLNIADFNTRYDVDVLSYFKEELDSLKQRGLIVIDDHIRLSKEGLYYGNEVFGMFI